MLCKAGGFSWIDCSPKFLTDEHWQDKAKKLSEDLARENIKVEQSHAPFNRYAHEPDDVFKEKLRRSVITAAEIGAKRIVIHADEYDYSKGYDSEKACRFAYEYFFADYRAGRKARDWSGCRESFRGYAAKRAHKMYLHG